MNDPNPIPDPNSDLAAIPWYKSAIVKGLVVTAITIILKHYHLTNVISSDDIAAYADDLLTLIAGAGLVWAAHGRATQKSAPKITLTKSKADTINKQVIEDSKTPST